MHMMVFGWIMQHVSYSRAMLFARLKDLPHAAAVPCQPLTMAASNPQHHTSCTNCGLQIQAVHDDTAMCHLRTAEEATQQ